MNENIFRRVEQKYVITKKQYDSLLKLISKYLNPDEFFESKIMNIYFDNVNNDVLINSLEKPVFKEKLRLRSYGVPKMDSNVFFEIKDKYKGIVGKRRIKMKLQDYYDYIDNKYEVKTQIMKEIDYYYKTFSLEPYVFVAYDRLSYKGKENNSLRITFDSHLRYRYDKLRLEMGDKGKNYFDEDMYIMEIKILGAMPLWLVNALSKLKIYPQSFSKVGSIYTKNKKEGSAIVC